ncbi:MAG: DUF4242 domain-containing protein [Sphingobacteriales bacterium]
MKSGFLFFTIAVFLISCKANKETKQANEAETNAPANDVKQTAYYIDVHNLGPGKVTFADVAKAHQKDLATQDKYGVSFIKYWVDEEKGKVYCLSKAADEVSIKNTHKEAHGLVPDLVYKVTDGPEAATIGNKQLYLDVHQFGPGAVTAKDVAGAHEKDLAVEKSHDVNFINYWVDEKDGIVMCLSEAPDSNAVKDTHSQAHGLLPAYVLKVKQGQ